ncbi:25231_t:CDS:1, partial [Gigaspora margarita]
NNACQEVTPSANQLHYLPIQARAFSALYQYGHYPVIYDYMIHRSSLADRAL